MNVFRIHKVIWMISVCLSITFSALKAQEHQVKCEALLQQDTLIIKNDVFQQKWLWNQGNISLVQMKTKGTQGQVQFSFTGTQPDLKLEGSHFVKNIDFKVEHVEADVFRPQHMKVTIENEYEGFKSKRVFMLFPNVAAVVCNQYLKYSSLKNASANEEKQVSGKENGLERISDTKSHLGYIGLTASHFKMQAVNFVDATDIHNNLVFEKSIIPFKWEEKLKGNLLLGSELHTNYSFYILKEAPNNSSQINYPGFDFMVSNSNVSIPFSGFPMNPKNQEWIQGYSTVMGLAKDKTSCLLELRNYLKNSINYSRDKYEMVMMNTWGDRGRDGRISEKFIIKELKEAKKLGITHFQIDDGWQQGLSSNSVHQTGNLWDEWSRDHWLPHKERFPNGLNPVVKKAHQYGIELGLWFHPSNAHSYASWNTDADVIISIYKETGISYFKIDGVEIKDKEAAVNLEKFFTKVKNETNGAVFFNLDLTAGVRGGYFSYRNFGNLFLENRYTDWGNYYPYQTLRNVWMLSRYFPPELLQIEFLNKWRNKEIYPDDDPFAPSNYSFDYLFAIAMVGQPLAWFEATGLPAEAFEVSNVIYKYRTIQSDFHEGTILPIGEEPSGTSWTGFQSIKNNAGYFLFFRENNPQNKTSIKTWLKEGTVIKLIPIMGNGVEKEIEVGTDGTIDIIIDHINSYKMFKYIVVNE